MDRIECSKSQINKTSNKIDIVLQEAFDRQKKTSIHIPILVKPVDELDWIAYVDVTLFINNETPKVRSFSTKVILIDELRCTA